MIGLALFVYIRPEHTRKVIESIRRNDFKKIYIFQDGIKNEKDRNDWEKVSELIKGINFTETEIHISVENKGLANSIIEGMNYVFEKHETAIALEDDVVLADGFKRLAETLFVKYKDNKRVMSICGGGYGVVIPEEYKYDIYFSYRMSSVAFGTWRDRWIGFERNPMMLREIYTNPCKKAMLEAAGGDIEKMMVASLKGSSDTWATYWAMYQINQLGFHIIPTKGYAVDIGREGSGTNSKSKIVRYDIELDGIDKVNYKLPDNIIINDDIMQDTKDLVSVSDDKFFVYFDVLCTWMKLYQRGQSVLPYFNDKNISEIYIYGMGKLAEFLCYDISKKVNVAGYIVENKQTDVYNGKTVYDMKSFDGMKDIPIVVTPSYDIAFINHFFKKCNIKNSVVMINEVVQYSFNKKENKE